MTAVAARPAGRGTREVRSVAMHDPLVRPLLDEHIRLTLAEPGCLAFAVTPNPTDPTRLDVAERFRDRASLEAHRRRTAASPWGAATRHLKRRYRVVAE